MTKKISFQGNLGAYSDLACRHVYPEMETIPCTSFADAFDAVTSGIADLAMIPIDNLIAGRVADIHHLIPRSNLYIIGEYYLPVHHCLLAPAGTKLEQVKKVYSHIHALPQCRDFIAEHKLEGIVFGDTARSAQHVADMKDPQCAAIASSLAGDIYGLETICKNIEDEKGNLTRFIILSPEHQVPEKEEGKKYITSLLFRVRSIPAALYKALGGFATNGINLTKLESYMVDGTFTAAQFYCDVEGHPEDRALQLALEELGFFAEEIRNIGTYEMAHIPSED